jgi:PhnB protein
MKVIVMVKASANSEAGKMPSQELMTAMGNFNEELVKAGVMQSGEGLKPSSEGFRIRFSGKSRSVTKGPFAETSELVAGYWVWQVNSMEEAIEWAQKCPNPMEDEDSDLEIRPFYEMEDFAEWDSSGEFQKKESALRNEVAMQTSTINNYLFFSGCCEQALAYYQQHLGARLGMLMRFSDSPDPVPEGMLQPGFENKVMHCEFSIGEVKIMASDGCDDKSNFSGFRLALTVQTKEEAERIFKALAQGGKVDMPLAETFWSPLFGQVSDQFGVGWMVMLPGQES